MLARLVLTNFRNHAELTLAPASGLVTLTGPNGAGKTNVLEAISLLAPGRGLRRASLGEMARDDGPGGFGIAASTREGDELATGTLADAPERRVVRVNGATAATGALAERLSVLWLTPAMDRLFVAPAAERRRFLDRLVLALHPAHGHEVTRYEAAMRERNRLLAEPAPDRAWLDALEARMAAHGERVAAARADTVAALDAALAGAPDTDFPRPALTLEPGPGADMPLLEALRTGRARDAVAGRTLAGPHRADLAVVHVAKGRAAGLSSTGEQKALLLAIVLGHAALVATRTGRAPLLLLDEVAAHLDPQRRRALFVRLGDFGQVWMTGTEPALFADAAAATSLQL